MGLVMLFISGCWTLAAIMPFPVSLGTRGVQVAAVAVSNVAFLLGVLTSAFSYAGMGKSERMSKVFLAFFSIGVAALALSIIAFTISYV